MNNAIQSFLLERINTRQYESASYRAATDGITSVPDPFRFGIREILVLADSADIPQAILRSVRWFAEQFGSKITVLCSIPPDEDQISLPELQNKIARTAGMEARQIRSIIASQGLLDSLQIINAAREEAADLIIIPGDIHLDPGHFWQVDPIEKLIRHAPCPILILNDSGPQAAAEQPRLAA